ncbi:GILT-like protein F37H8.5 [Trichinella spiralis]|uniref:GILT-like protein F37H8.5 n=1 Tax=Trichinella spiralis TaxID=6334 RepID=A0A0V1ALF3_TRISP|nr:GILT-like protein F37H8.5 [Trichinella spiralis]
MAEITENVKPHPHYFVPWILINDLSTTQLQIYQNGLFNFLCDPHSGSVPKGSAEFTNFFKQRKNLQLPHKNNHRLPTWRPLLSMFHKNFGGMCRYNYVPLTSQLQRNPTGRSTAHIVLTVFPLSFYQSKM